MRLPRLSLPRPRLPALIAMLAVVLCAIAAPQLGAQQRRLTPVEQAPRTAQAQPAPAADPRVQPGTASQPRETVQADVSTRRIAVTSSFSGTAIIVFGAVDHSRQATAESGLYDVVIVVAGPPTKVVVRKKSRVAGIWLNTSSVGFARVPSYYAIASTRPIDEVASKEVLKASGIGFDYVPMKLDKSAETLSAAEIRQYRDAIVRIKQRDRLYRPWKEGPGAGKDEYSVAFVGKSLFRATIELPANVIVGPFETQVFLFRDGELLSRYTSRVNLEREGLESFIHGFAFDHPFWYGLTTVIIAVGAGLLASVLFRRGGH